MTVSACNDDAAITHALINGVIGLGFVAAVVLGGLCILSMLVWALKRGAR